MATHSSILAWRILWTEEPGGLQSIGSQRARHDWNSWAWGLIVVTTRASQWAEKISLGRGSLLKTTWENWLLNFTPGESQGTLVCKDSEKAYGCVCVCVLQLCPTLYDPMDCLLLGRKAMTNLDSILKSRDITLPTKVHLFKAMVFPVVMYGCESWTIKKAEHWRIDAFELWCWRRLLRVPWTARRSNQSILKEIGPEYSLEGLMLKLKLQYFGHLRKNRLMGKEPDAGKDWRREEKGKTEDETVGWHHRRNGHEFE